MPLDARNRFPVMALTMDGLGITHSGQAARLCAAGARWIQLRMKDAPAGEWLAEAAEAAGVCRRSGAILIVNDSVDIALASGADGVHLGGPDADWAGARRRLGPGRILGGTVNDRADALRALACGCLDYAGVGPLRFTSTKRNLSPVLGLEGVRALIAELGSIPAWVIGGVGPSDLPGLRAAGAAGVAVSSRLYLGDRIGENLRAFLESWSLPADLLADPVPRP
jgi:thiamine-phosphate pyrophosphorylase